MKKLFLLGALSLAALGVSTAPASAWCDWLFGCHCPACRSHRVNICCRPYNAFDPPCCELSGHGGWGGMFHGRGSGANGYPPSSYNGAFCEPGSSCINSGCCDSGCLPAPETSAPAPAPGTAPATQPGAANPTTAAPAGPVFAPPAPNPLPATSQMYNYPVPTGQRPAYTAGYQPSYYPNAYPPNYPGYYPANPMGYYQAMPASPMPNYRWPAQSYGR